MISPESEAVLRMFLFEKSVVRKFVVDDVAEKKFKN
jgi:hypothetical protein